jgi:hypothetical protein
LTKLEPDWWIELESSYQERIVQRKELYQRYGESVVAWSPGSELACKELMEMVLQYVTLRYPQYFSLLENNTIFENKILGTRSVISDQHPLLVLLDHIPEDFAIMLRHPETGYYHLRAGMICSALGWNLGTKFGMQLHEIHAPIPDYKEKMQFSMDRYDALLCTSQYSLCADFSPRCRPTNPYSAAHGVSRSTNRCICRPGTLMKSIATIKRPTSPSIVVTFVWIGRRFAGYHCLVALFSTSRLSFLPPKNSAQSRTSRA